ncbi:hypothetical protein [Burkholderia ubonensis]|uniref:hypothetical protein n=1 Tax=Burkholderia ubonensis TaxID=101571 RepID=UPI00075DF4A5|nr:hypothetical protein [Burkholderia ubonensis]KVQ37078.1 hypothetical protein WK00_13610 [Burkholderia ubonensis]
MSVGLQIFDAQGRALLDATSRAGRVSGVAVLDTSGSPGYRAADLSGGTPFWAFIPDWLFRHVSMNAPVPVVSIDANGIGWRYSDSPSGWRTPMSGTLVYGVY